MMIFARALRTLHDVTLATGARTAASTYLITTLALGVYAILRGGAGAGDLFPGAAFLLLTAPVSIPAILWIPASMASPMAFDWALVTLGPVGTVALVTAMRRLGGRHS